MDNSTPDNSTPGRGPVVPAPNDSLPAGSKTPSKNGLYVLIVFLVILVIVLGAAVACLLILNGNGHQKCWYNWSIYDEGETVENKYGSHCFCKYGDILCTSIERDKEDRSNQEQTQGQAVEQTQEQTQGQTVEMTFDGPTGTDTYNISFVVPEGNVDIVYPDPDSYPAPYLSAASLDGGTYYIGISHPYESFYSTYTSVEKRTIQNPFHELGDVYYFPIDMGSYSNDSFPEITAQTHVGYGVDNQVSLNQECSDGGMSSAEPPCGRRGILGDWSDEWPFLTITCIFEKGSENLQICDDVLNSLLVQYTEK